MNRNTLPYVDVKRLTPEARAARKIDLERRIERPCPTSKHQVHSDPDNCGLCIYCGCILDLIEGDDY